jgi:hypothetical protein
MTIARFGHIENKQAIARPQRPHGLSARFFDTPGAERCLLAGAGKALCRKA